MEKYLKEFREYRKTEECWTEVTIIDAQHRIYKILEEQDVSKAELAKRINVSRQQINEFFNKGHNATIKTLGKIAHALGKKVDICFIDNNVHNSKQTSNVEKLEVKPYSPQLKKLKK